MNLIEKRKKQTNECFIFDRFITNKRSFIFERILKYKDICRVLKTKTTFNEISHTNVLLHVELHCIYSSNHIC